MGDDISEDEEGYDEEYNLFDVFLCVSSEI